MARLFYGIFDRRGRNGTGPNLQFASFHDATGGVWLHFEDNPASGRVLEKAGFLYTGEVRAEFSRARGGEARTRRMIWLP